MARQHKPDTIRLRLVIAGTLVCYAISLVAVLSLKHDNTDGIVYLLIAILPTTVMNILNVKIAAKHTERINEIAEHTNGPLTDMQRKIEDIHSTLTSDSEKSSDGEG